MLRSGENKFNRFLSTGHHSSYLPFFKFKKVIKCFYDIITLTWKLYNSNLCTKFESPIKSRGIVEGTRLEAKTRTQKKSETKTKDTPRGQGQKCLSPRPRTKGNRRKCFKNKRSSIFFSGNLQKKKTKKVFVNFPRGFWRFPT